MTRSQQEYTHNVLRASPISIECPVSSSTWEHVLAHRFRRDGAKTGARSDRCTSRYAGRVLLTLRTSELWITDIVQTLFATVPDVSRKLGQFGRGSGGVQPFRRPAGARNIRHTKQGLERRWLPAVQDRSVPGEERDATGRSGAASACRL